jgi:hypothetical protein
LFRAQILASDLLSPSRTCMYVPHARILACCSSLALSRALSPKSAHNQCPSVKWVPCHTHMSIFDICLINYVYKVHFGLRPTRQVVWDISYSASRRHTVDWVLTRLESSLRLSLQRRQLEKKVHLLPPSASTTSPAHPPPAPVHLPSFAVRLSRGPCLRTRPVWSWSCWCRACRLSTHPVSRHCCAAASRSS